MPCWSSSRRPQRQEVPAQQGDAAGVGFFHELDAWTEYWDIYHPETRGRFYFGDGAEPGLLSRLLPRDQRPAVFVAWTRMALGSGTPRAFAEAVGVAETAAAVGEVDALLGQIFARHFGPADAPAVRESYLDAVFRFATDQLPPAS